MSTGNNNQTSGQTTTTTITTTTTTTTPKTIPQTTTVPSATTTPTTVSSTTTIPLKKLPTAPKSSDPQGYDAFVQTLQSLWRKVGTLCVSDHTPKVLWGKYFSLLLHF